ncbi:hypothetical protein NDU88_002358, partial [Pleurodeles waltl]
LFLLDYCLCTCNRAPPDAGSGSERTAAGGYPRGTRGIPDVMTSNVIRQIEGGGTTDGKGESRNPERDADVRESRRDERRGPPREKENPAVEKKQRTESGNPWAPPAPVETKSGDRLQAGHVPGGAWPSQFKSSKMLTPGSPTSNNDLVGDPRIPIIIQWRSTIARRLRPLAFAML